MTIPSWLDPAKEIKHPDQPSDFVNLPDMDKAVEGILWCMAALLHLGCTPEQAIEITSNFISETGWFRKWRGNNLGGWKITAEYVKEYKKTHNGECPLWWQAAGHIASGDPPVVYYRGYETILGFIVAWLERFLPKNPPADHRYFKASKAFYAQSPSWFKEICLAGYKGPVTQANPGGSIASFALIVERAKKILAQHLLMSEGLLEGKPDAVWGAKSVAACKAYQIRRNLQTKTGELDKATFAALCVFDL